MDGSLIALLSAAGLAGAAGHRAFIPALGLGGLHHYAAYAAKAGADPFFALSESFLWLADPVVMAVLGVLVVVEILAEMNPDAPELVNLALKAPKAIGGFIAVAAAVGTMSDSAVMLGASGLVGAAGSLSVDSLRAGIKHAVDEPMSDATAGLSTKVLGLGETGWAAGLTIGSIVWPAVVLVAGVLFGGLWFARGRIGKAAMVACAACGEPRHSEATACPHCQAALA